MRKAASSIALLSLWVASACGPTPRDGDPPSIRIEPADARITVVDGAPVVQAYTAQLIAPDGATDVTSDVVFQVVEGGFGSWTGPSLTVTGAASGHARVVATLDDISGETGLTVFLKDRRFDGDVPP